VAEHTYRHPRARLCTARWIALASILAVAGALHSGGATRGVPATPAARLVRAVIASPSQVSPRRKRRSRGAAVRRRVRRCAGMRQSRRRCYRHQLGVRQPAHNAGTSGNGVARRGGTSSTSGGSASGRGAGNTSGGATSAGGGAVVGAVPDGVPVPSGGWSVEYADGFGSPLGTGAGQDNTVYPSTKTGSCQGPNEAGNELDWFDCSQVATDSGGLELRCKYSPNPSFGNRPYECGAVVTGGITSQPSGYKLFQFKPAGGQTWAFEIKAQFPPNYGVGDANFWSADPTWHDFEIDFFESWGFRAPPGGDWCSADSDQWLMTDPTWGHPNGSAFTTMTQSHENLCADEGFDPSLAVHTYTTVIHPDLTMEEYIDGHPAHWNGATKMANSPTTLAGISSGGATTFGGLIAMNAMKQNSSNPGYLPFTSGTTTYRIRSIAVYENTTANGANTINGGTIAPGTQIH
jgi:hypothetical protein